MHAMYVVLTLVFAQAIGSDDPPPAAARAKPDWVERGDFSEPPVRYRVVRSELWATPDEAAHDAVEQAAPIVREFIAEADARAKRGWDVPARLIHDRLVSGDYLEKVDRPYGTMYRSHLLLELSPQTRDALAAEWRVAFAAQQHEFLQRRLTQLGAGFGFILVCLMSLVGYLKLDDATRGYYSGWLKTGAGAVVAGTAAALYTLVV